MTDQEIRDMYDRDPNLTIRDLVWMTGRSFAEVKTILMEANDA